MTSSMKSAAVTGSGFLEMPGSDWRAVPGQEPETVLKSPRSEPAEAAAVPLPASLPAEFPSVWRRLFGAPGDISTVEPGVDPAEGMTLGHFTIQRRIGAGAMGSVFLAYDDRLHRHVALKILSPLHAVDVSTVQRFQNEAQAAARLDHDHVARVYYYGEEGGLHFIAYEYIAGINLRDLLRQRGRLSPAEVVNFAIQITTALRHTSRHGVVHRDIKPSNIIVTPQGRAKLVDLGLAKRDGNEPGGDLTVAGTTLGTFDYISPEQARDPRAVDVRSDLYSLGCTLYHLLTGEPPYPSGTVLQKLLDHQAQDTPEVATKNRRVSPALSAVVRKMMASDPRRRYATPEDLLRDLAVIARGLDLRVVSSESATLVPEARLRGAWWDRNFGWVVTAAALLLCVATLQMARGFLDRVTHWSGTLQEDGAGVIPAPRVPSDGLAEAKIRATELDPVSTESDDGPPGITSLPTSKADVSAASPTTGPSVVDPATVAASDVNDVVKPEVAKPLETSTEKTASPFTTPVNSPADAPLPPITIVGSGLKTEFSSLEHACSEADDGDIIELRGIGPHTVAEHSLRLIDKHLTIRAAKGAPRPQLEVSDGIRIGDSSTTRLITVSGGSLQLVNVDLVSHVNPSTAGLGWALFSLERPEQLKLEGVTITVLNPARRPASVFELGSATGGAGKLKIGLPSLPPEILVSDCVIRGAATLMSVREALAARFVIEDSLIALDDSLVHVAARPSMNNGENSQLNLELTHATLLLGRSLIVARHDNNLNDRPIPLFVTAQNNLISIGKEQPLVEIAGNNTMELNDSFKWSGKRNGYDGIQSFWVSQKNVTLDFSAWKSLWGGETTGSVNSAIRWQNPDRSRAGQDVRPADVFLESTERNPAVEAADDGTNLGAPLEKLPVPPSLDAAR
jgi:serine/threonine-protein kinase